VEGTTQPNLLKAIFPKSAADKFAQFLHLETVGELLRHYPRDYIEADKPTSFRDLVEGEFVTVVAKVKAASTGSAQNNAKGRGPLKVTRVKILDRNNSELSLTFFNNFKAAKDIRVGDMGMFAGELTSWRDQLQLKSPEFYMLGRDTEEDQLMRELMLSNLIPVYRGITGLPSWEIAKMIRHLLKSWDGASDPLPLQLLLDHNLTDLTSALQLAHKPAHRGDVMKAHKRLKWDEAIALQIVLAQRKATAYVAPAPICQPVPDGIAAAFDKQLPFDLTKGQREVGVEIAADLAVAHPMNRLLQGDVGSGKTIVALRAMLQAIDAGRQTALLAPTEVLAAQHSRSLREMLGDLARAGEFEAPDHATSVTLLTGSLGAKAKREALLNIVSGKAGIVVGTHALIQDAVEFADLGLVVIDEQHRFGVEQRDALRSKAQQNPHTLVMTATPIPRTIAMTVYGDLDTSALTELPAGRSPIGTTVVPVKEKPTWVSRVWERVREEVGKGHQAYVVCPAIGDEQDEKKKAKKKKSPEVDPETGETLETEDLGEERRPPLAVMKIAEQLETGELSGLRIGILHGRLHSDVKDATMTAFAAGKIDVLVSTTVVEVGVNVPNATVMVVMDADRFGISQLHQLRGRVGRGNVPGVCLLVSEIPMNSSTGERLRAVASTTDGFELANMDLRLRREGDILGAAQSGTKSGLKLLNLLTDQDLIYEARQTAQEIVAEDPKLTRHRGLAGMAQDVIDRQRAEFLDKY
jgi:ATP-dependent DNA helicase RecG